MSKAHPHWIVTTLRTTTPDHRDLQMISVHTPWIHPAQISNCVDSADFRGWIGGSACQGWSEVDHLLARLSESRPIRLDVRYMMSRSLGEDGAKGLMGILLPEATARGMVDMVGY